MNNFDDFDSYISPEELQCDNPIDSDFYENLDEDFNDEIDMDVYYEIEMQMEHMSGAYED
jgi:hypothetical protein